MYQHDRGVSGIAIPVDENEIDYEKFSSLNPYQNGYSGNKNDSESNMKISELFITESQRKQLAQILELKKIPYDLEMLYDLNNKAIDMTNYPGLLFNFVSRDIDFEHLRWDYDCFSMDINETGYTENTGYAG